eukprot:4220651-Prymnesium_polylepis.1
MTAAWPARGVRHPGHHRRGRGPGCADHSDARGGNDPPPCPGHGVRSAHYRQDGPQPQPQPQLL